MTTITDTVETRTHTYRADGTHRFGVFSTVTDGEDAVPCYTASTAGAFSHRWGAAKLVFKAAVRTYRLGCTIHLVDFDEGRVLAYAPAIGEGDK